MEWWPFLYFIAVDYGKVINQLVSKAARSPYEPDIPVQAQKTIPIMYISYDGRASP